MTEKPRAERAGLLFFLCLKSPNGEKTDLTFRGCFWRKNITWGRDSGKGKVYSELPLPASQLHVFCCA